MLWYLARCVWLSAREGRPVIQLEDLCVRHPGARPDSWGKRSLSSTRAGTARLP